jgi:hypothetical protein
LEQRPSHQSSFQHVELMDLVLVPIVIQQTQPIIQGVWSSVPIMGIIEQPLVQQNISVIIPPPTIEITLTCAYC